MTTTNTFILHYVNICNNIQSQTLKIDYGLNTLNAKMALIESNIVQL